MNFKSIFLFLISNISMADIMYQDGYSKEWFNKNNVWNTSINQTITFSHQFTRVPQVFVIPLILESELNSNSFGFEISIVSITTSNFIVNLFSSTSTTKNLAFKWVAIDNQRIEVLTQISVLPETKNLSHINVNSKKGIIILTSLAGQKQMDFTLDLGIITTTTVEVKIVSSGLEKIGYTVLLGPEEFSAVSDKIIILPKNFGDLPALNYNFTVVANTVQLFYIQNFAFNSNSNLRIQLLPYFYTDTCSYTLCSYSSSAAAFTKFTHQQALINFDLNAIKPLQFKKSRITNYQSSEQLNVIELTIVELSLTYSQPINENYVFVQSSYSQITFILNVKCIQNYKIIGKYYQCQTFCSYKQTKHFCYLSENSLRISVLFQQQMVAHEQLYVTMTTNQIQIYQTVVNQIQESILILQFDIN